MTDELAALNARVAALEAENAELKAVVERLDGASPRTSDARSRESGGAPVSRRSLLRRLGTAAAAGAGIAVGGATLGAAPALAGTDGDVVLGGDNHADASTQITTSAGAPYALVVTGQNTGIFGRSDLGIGVQGYSYGADAGVAGLSRATTNGAPGVRGESLSHWGVGGISDGDSGVVGISNAAPGGPFTFGVVGAGKGIGLMGKGDVGQLYLEPGAQAGPPTAFVQRRTGEIYVDSLGTLFQCVESGFGGTWVRVGFNPLTPARIADTRTGTPANPYTGQHLGPHGGADTLTVTVTGSLAVAGGGTVSVPTQASAVVLNVTATNIGAEGYLSVFPADASFPGVSNVNFDAPPKAPAAVPNQVTVRVGTGSGAGKIKILNGSNAPVDVFVDIAGFFS